MARPALVAVDADPESRQLLEAELRERYECHYRVELFSSGLDACELLEQLSADGTDLALLLVGQQLADLSVRELLAATRRLHPHARRVLLFAWGQQGDDATGELISGAIDRGEIDHYVERPSSPADELFHHEISGLLLEWADGERTSPHTTYVVGESWSGRAYELRESLGRCAMPHSFTLADSELGQKLLSRLGQPGKLPLVVFPDGTYLEDPTNAEMASASGSPVSPGGASSSTS